jgi:5'-nucleotidase
MRILLTNDDGVYAPGIAALKKYASRIGEVTVVAPDVERSATAHSITLDRPLRVREVFLGDVLHGYSVDGSPADCVKIGVKRILDEAPDIVLSGINPGANVGINVLYSGTVAAALEGAILGITSFSVSTAEAKKPDYDASASLACSIISRILTDRPPSGTLINLNLPACRPDQIRGIAIAPQSTVSYQDDFDVRMDPRGGRYYWMTGEMLMNELPPESDMRLLEDGYVTLTPLQYDLTDSAMLQKAQHWSLNLNDL